MTRIGPVLIPRSMVALMFLDDLVLVCLFGQNTRNTNILIGYMT